MVGDRAGSVSLSLDGLTGSVSLSLDVDSAGCVVCSFGFGLSYVALLDILC